MSMFCMQCQEAAKNTGCTVKGVCGKQADTAQLQDLLLYTLKGIAFAGEYAPAGVYEKEAGFFTIKALFCHNHQC